MTDPATEAAEAIRILNHQTYSPGWAEQPGDVSAVASGLLRLAERLPQALQQVYAELDRLDQVDAIRMDNNEEGAVAAGRVLVALESTRALAEQLRSTLTAAANGLSHMGGHFDDSDREPCGESGCICYGTGADHVDCACACDCPRDDYGQLIHEG
jgi:hypothetical protein